MLEMSLLVLMTTASAAFITMSHPLAMGLTLLLQTLLISTFTGLINFSFWFSYILFLVFLGGMLVLFIYVTSLASNEMFSISSKSLISIMLITSCIMTLLLVIDPSSLMNLMHINPNPNTAYNLILPLALTKLYSSHSILTLLLIIYLLLTLIVIVNITTPTFGPMRPSN